MMVDLKSGCVFLFLISVCYASVARELPNPKRSEGHCLPTAYDLGEMDHGESRDVTGKCAEASCQDDGGVVYVSCGAVGTSPPCRVTKEDFSKPYPKCCPQVVCN